MRRPRPGWTARWSWSASPISGPAGPEQVQFFGTVISVDRSGTTLRLGGEREGESYELPPALEAFEPAPPGEYRLRSTGEIVTDPDYTTSWEITPPMN